MNRLLLRVDLGLRIRNLGVKYQRLTPKLKILCFLAALSCLGSVCLADEGLIGKWRALDQTNIIYGFEFIPELKFSQDGNLYAGLTYGYRIIDEGKFVWELGNGIEKVYKYQISGDILMIYSVAASDLRARFKRVR
jgi:hypothetical protein